MTEQEQLEKVRRDYSTQGWILLAYQGIMNFAVMLPAGLMTIYLMFTAMIDGAELDVDAFTAQILDASGWGYLLAILIGVVILLLWKKPKYFADTLWAKGKPMSVGSFLALASVFMSCQFISQLALTGIESLLNLFDGSMEAYLQNANISTDGLGLFLYVGLGAPISEELLFRGVLLRSMAPHGKRFAIFASALLFGLYHGNMIQAPFAFLVGLVLGYVALEYNIGWAIVLHMFNNLIMADTMTRLTSGLPEPVSNLIFWVVMGAFAVAAVIALILKREEVVQYFRQETVDPVCRKAFLSAPGIVVLLVVLIMTIVLSFAVVFMA